MAIQGIAANRTANRPPAPAAAGTSGLVKGLAKLIDEQADNLDAYELVGPDAADAGSAKGKAIAKSFPQAAQAFFQKQLDAARDNDGSPALLKIPLSEVSDKLKGSAFVVRWTSEDQNLDRLFVFDRAGKPIAKGWTDTGADFKWEPAKGPFRIDDTPHSA